MQAIYTTNWNNNGVRVYEYHVNPSVWSTSGSSIGRIGVIAHETGHFLGLPDLYDYGDGSGIGSWGMMANSWGFNGNQYNPPIMSAWSKNVLGWVTPTVVSSSGSFSLRQACENSDMIRIDRGYPSGQYLLIENRQPCGFETAMPQGGLAIFYIDDNANNVLGYPGQSGWPGNGDHYEVALLQADGNYNLEKGQGRGDSGDVFHAGGVNSIGPDGTSAGNAYPNTKPYLSSAHTVDLTISNISGAGSTMTFDITFGSGSTPSPVSITPSPTAAPSTAPISKLKVSYYAVEWNSLPTEGFSSFTPFKTDIIPTIDYRAGNGAFATSGRSDYVAALFEGQLEFDSTGESVKFCLTSDDGSKLKIDGSVIINNDGLHGDRTYCATGTFTGRVSVEVEFFEKSTCTCISILSDAFLFHFITCSYIVLIYFLDSWWRYLRT